MSQLLAPPRRSLLLLASLTGCQWVAGFDDRRLVETSAQGGAGQAQRDASVAAGGKLAPLAAPAQAGDGARVGGGFEEELPRGGPHPDTAPCAGRQAPAVVRPGDLLDPARTDLQYGGLPPGAGVVEVHQAVMTSDCEAGRRWRAGERQGSPSVALRTPKDLPGVRLDQHRCAASGRQGKGIVTSGLKADDVVPEVEGPGCT